MAQGRLEDPHIQNSSQTKKDHNTSPSQTPKETLEVQVHEGGQRRHAGGLDYFDNAALHFLGKGEIITQVGQGEANSVFMISDVIKRGLNLYLRALFGGAVLILLV